MNAGDVALSCAAVTRLAASVALLVVMGACKGGAGTDGASPALARGKIDGKSISLITRQQLVDALKKLGHGVADMGPPRRGATVEAFDVALPSDEYGAPSFVAIVRPAPLTDASTTDGPASAFSQSGYFAKLGCPTYLEDDALVAVCVEGHPAEARALLDKLVWH